MSRSRDAGAPRKLICVPGSASGVPGSGETTSLDAVELGAASPIGAATAPPAASTATARAATLFGTMAGICASRLVTWLSNPRRRTQGGTD